MDRFHVPMEQELRAFTKLSLQDSLSSATSAALEGDLTPTPTRGPVAAALHELFGPQAPVGLLFEKMCGGADAQLHDWYALRTEPGSPRQPVRSVAPMSFTV
jgi:hypothetical protein